MIQSTVVECGCANANSSKIKSFFHSEEATDDDAEDDWETLRLGILLLVSRLDFLFLLGNDDGDDDFSDRLLLLLVDLDDDVVRNGIRLIGSVVEVVVEEVVPLLLLNVCLDGTLGIFDDDDFPDMDRLGDFGATVAAAAVAVGFVVPFMDVKDRSDLLLKTRSGFLGGDRSNRALPESVRTGFRLGDVLFEWLLLRAGSPFFIFLLLWLWLLLSLIDLLQSISKMHIVRFSYSHLMENLKKKLNFRH